MSPNDRLDTPDEALDPAAAMNLYRTGRARARTAGTDLSRLWMATWGVAWLVGYLCLWAGSRMRDGEPPAWAAGVFFGLLAVAAVVSMVAGLRSSRRVVGPTALAGALYGWSWFVAFGGGMTILALVVNRYDVSGPAVAVLYNSVVALIAGSLYLAGSAAFKEPAMFAIGTVFVVLGVIGALAGVPAGYLVMALAGGGLMLIGFVVATVLTVHARTAAR